MDGMVDGWVGVRCVGWGWGRGSGEGGGVGMGMELGEFALGKEGEAVEDDLGGDEPGVFTVWGKDEGLEEEGHKPERGGGCFGSREGGGGGAVGSRGLGEGLE